MHSTAVYCCVLYNSVYYFSVLYSTEAYCSVIRCNSALYCTAMNCTEMFWEIKITTLHFTALNKMRNTTIYWSLLSSMVGWYWERWRSVFLSLQKLLKASNRRLEEIVDDIEEVYTSGDIPSFFSQSYTNTRYSKERTLKKSVWNL